jgi:osmotically-inducible protein OsmY
MTAKPLAYFAASAILLGSAALLQGCAPLIVGTAATGAAVTNDKRTTGTIVEDQAIETKAYDIIKADEALAETTHINTCSYNQMVLLTGEAPTEELRQRIVDYVTRIAKVRHVYNEITLRVPSSTSARANDTLITGKVKTKLVSIKDISALDVKVVTEAGVVYLMGILDKPTGDAVAEAVATVGGIVKVVKLFETPPA